MNIPSAHQDATQLERGVLLLRDDLTLQVSVASQALEVQLSPQDAYGLAMRLMGNLEALHPWESDRKDAELIRLAHHLSFVALGFAMTQQTPAAVLSESDEEGRKRLHTVIARAFALLATFPSEGQIGE